MSNMETIEEKEYLKDNLLKLENYFNTLPEEKLLNIEETKEYNAMYNIIARLNTLNSAL